MAAVILGAAITGPIALGLIICMLGFGCEGVRGDSFAAERQSLIGNVAAGSCFACKLDVLIFFNFILWLPCKRCLIIFHSKIIFQFSS